MLKSAEEREMKLIAFLVGESLYFGIVLFVFFDFVILIEESVILIHCCSPIKT